MQDFPKFPLGFGGAAISGEGRGYGFGSISEAESLDLLRAAYDLGFRVFDTAPIYGFGLSEKRLAKAFKDKREQVFYVNKAGVTWDQHKRVDKSNDPKVITKMLDQSLKDLNTYYIDLYMIHWPDSRHDIRPAMEILAKRKEQGDILRIGLCNTFEEDFNKASEVALIEAIQDSWNAFSHFETQERYGFLKSNTIWKMGYGTLDKGILTGRVDENRKFEPEDCRSWAPWWKKEDKNTKFDLVRHLKNILRDYDFSLLDFAIHFAKMHNNFMDINLVGARSKEQLLQTYQSLEKKVAAQTIAEILERWKEFGYSKEVTNA